jgi:hypothetical protein
VKISRVVGAAALSVAVAASVASPALALTSTGRSTAVQPASPGDPAAPTRTTAQNPAQNPACAELANRIVTRMPGAGGDASAVPPTAEEVTVIVTDTVNNVTALRKTGCQTNTSSKNATPPSPRCASATAKLLNDLFGAAGDTSQIQQDAAAVTAACSAPAAKAPAVPAAPAASAPHAK